jgi:hypothetical protein
MADLIWKQYDGVEVTPTDNTDKTLADALVKANSLQDSADAGVGYYVNVINPFDRSVGMVLSDAIAAENPTVAQTIEIFNGAKLDTKIADLEGRLPVVLTTNVVKVVGATGDFATISEAINDAAKYTGSASAGSYTYTIEVEDGYLISTPVTVFNMDLSHVVITSPGKIYIDAALTDTAFWFSGCKAPTFSGRIFVDNGTVPNDNSRLVIDFTNCEVTLTAHLDGGNGNIGMYSCDVTGYYYVACNYLEVNLCTFKAKPRVNYLEIANSILLSTYVGVIDSMVVSASTWHNSGTIFSSGMTSVTVTDSTITGKNFDADDFAKFVIDDTSFVAQREVANILAMEDRLIALETA